MKKIVFIFGVIITIISILSIVPYISDYSDLSKYGKGYITGKLLVMLFGISLIISSIKNKSSQ